MKYVHGTDKKGHDRLMVWGNRVGFAVVLLAFLFFLWYARVIAGWAFTGSVEGILFLLGIILYLAASLCGMYESVWRNAKYYMDKDGITLVFPFHSKKYPWSTFKMIFVSQIRRGARTVTAYDYIIFMISECGALTRSISVPSCWKYQSKFLVIRSTDERIHEFSKFCIISARPNFKDYQYSD